MKNHQIIPVQAKNKAKRFKPTDRLLAFLERL
jgi:hypothetical protein